MPAARIVLSVSIRERPSRSRRYGMTYPPGSAWSSSFCIAGLVAADLLPEVISAKTSRYARL